MAANQEIDEVIEELSRLLDTGRYQDHQSLLRLSLVRFPDSGEIALRAAYAVADGAPERAKVLAQRAARLAPNDPTTLFHAASLLTELHEFKAARKIYRALSGMLTEEFPFLPDVMVLFGKLLMENGNLAEAEQKLTLVFDRDPQTRGAGNVLAELYRRQGRLDEALKVVTAAQQHHPDDPSLVGLERQIRSAMGDRSD